MKKKFVISAVLNIGTTFEDHKHLKLFEFFIVARSEEEAKKIIKENLNIEIYPKSKNHKLMNAQCWANLVYNIDATTFQ